MLWYTVHGEKYEAVERQCEQQKVPFEKWPLFLQNRPELLPGLDLFYEAFMRLGSDRSIGMSVGPIPFTATVKYAEFYGFDAQTAELLVEHISAMDSAYLKHHQKSQRSK